MEETELYKLTDEDLLAKKKKLKNRKIFSAFAIGVAVVAWSLGSKKNLIAFLLPMLLPIYFIYKIIKNSKKDKKLETLLKERNLN
ncbi:hypothetical protein M4I21_18115 [Cellulophaga sp. 20_2_10]|uniref:hypothetical protein n=1 Tax=Cellulophaga sp. 20_2_10 TaxID=2942476 RepID=UPI00201A6822|nr:hypothetical protein [Cellulophaga sp. 20_2_10]MCL5247734.1 hypothetical protein [Cellulophaga sp. 20_2_10]